MSFYYCTIHTYVHLHVQAYAHVHVLYIHVPLIRCSVVQAANREKNVSTHTCTRDSLSMLHEYM